MTGLRWAALAAFVLAVGCWAAETMFYGGVTADGVLQESFFMPLTFLLLMLGTVLAALSLVWRR